jgi:hypothetical protein
MQLPRCGVCTHAIDVGENFVGIPVGQITGIGQSSPTGFEVMFHAECFGKKMRNSNAKTPTIIAVS